MHMLDLVVYIVGLFVIAYALPDEFTEEIGGIVGLIIMLIYTIIYVIVFWFLDYNIVEVLPQIYEQIAW